MDQRHSKRELEDPAEARRWGVTGVGKDDSRKRLMQAASVIRHYVWENAVLRCKLREYRKLGLGPKDGPGRFKGEVTLEGIARVQRERTKERKKIQRERGKSDKRSNKSHKV